MEDGFPCGVVERADFKDQALSDAGAQVFAQRESPGRGGAGEQQRLGVGARAVEGVEERNLGIVRELIDVVDGQQGVFIFRQAIRDFLRVQKKCRTTFVERAGDGGPKQVASSAAGVSPQVEMCTGPGVGGSEPREVFQQFGVAAGDKVFQRRQAIRAQVENELFHAAFPEVLSRGVAVATFSGGPVLLGTPR